MTSSFYFRKLHIPVILGRMDTFVTIGAIFAAIALKLVFFYFYAKHAEKKAPKKSETFELVQRGEAKKRVLVTGGCGFLGR